MVVLEVQIKNKNSMDKKTISQLAQLIMDAREKCDSNSTLKINFNGTPLVNIENGVDMLESDSSKPTEPSVACETPLDFDSTVSTSDPAVTGFTYTEPEPSEPSPIQDDEDDVVRICDGVVKDPFNELYYLDQFAGTTKLLVPEVELRFTEGVENYMAPGITDIQLAFILLYRNRDNKERYDALMQFIKTFC